MTLYVEAYHGADEDVYEEEPFFGLEHEDEPLTEDQLALEELLRRNPSFFDEDDSFDETFLEDEEPLTDDQLREIDFGRRIARSLRPLPWTFKYKRKPTTLRHEIEALFPVTFDPEPEVRSGALAFFIHLWLGTELDRDGWHTKAGTWVPSDAKFISNKFGKRKYGGAIVIALERAGYVRSSGYSVDARKCRAFEVDPVLMIRLAIVAIEHAEENNWCNVVTGDPIDLKAREEELFKEQKGATKKRPGRPVRADRFEVNWAAGKAEVLRRLRLVDALGSAPEAKDIDENTLEGAAKERRSLMSAVRSLLAIRSASTFRWSRKKPGFGSYIPTYRDITRLYEEGGRYQTCPQWLKAKLIEGTPAKNYDIPSCHVRCAVVLAGQLNAHRRLTEQYEDLPAIPMKAPHTPRPRKGRRAPTTTPWLRELVDQKDARARLAAKHGVPEGLLKVAINVSLYGGPISSHSSCELGRKIAELCPNEDGKAVASRLREALPWVKPFQDALTTYLEAIIANPTLLWRSTDRLRSMIEVRRSKGQVQVINAKGKGLVVTDEIGIPQVLAHLYAGMEQFDVQLTGDLCRKHGISMFANEHDGGVFAGPIPEEVIEEVMEQGILRKRFAIEEKDYKVCTRLDEMVRLLRSQRELDAAGIECIEITRELPMDKVEWMTEPEVPGLGPEEIHEGLQALVADGDLLCRVGPAGYQEYALTQQGREHLTALGGRSGA